MKPKNAIPFILALGMTAGSTAVYAQTVDLNTDTDLSTEVETDSTAEVESTDPLLIPEDDAATAETEADPLLMDEGTETAEEVDPMQPIDGEASTTAEADAMTPLGETEADTDMAMDDESVEAEGQLTSIASLTDTEELVGARAYDANEEWIGEISAVIPADGDVEEQYIIDVGGFLGIGEKPVAMTAEDLQVQVDAEGDVEHVVVGHSMTEIEAMPEVEM